MFARPRPAPFAVSLLTHGLILVWLASGPVREKPKSLYAQVIAPHASKLVWYNFREKLPDVSPAAARRPAQPPRADVKMPSQEIAAATPEARRARQFVWQPAPKLELHTELRSPNVLAIHVVRPEPPPKPKLFVPPPKTPAPAAQAPTLAAPPEIQSARNVNGASKLANMQPAKAPPRTFVAPQSVRPPNKPAALPEAPAVAAAVNPTIPAPLALSGGAPRPIPRTFVQPGQGAKTSPRASPMPEPPALPEAAVSMAIVGLNPTANVPPPAPEGARNAEFSAAPEIRNTDGEVRPVDGANLTVPGLLVHSGVPDTKPTLMARASPTSVENLRAAMRSTLPAATIAGPHLTAVRVSSPPDPIWNGRDAYAVAIQMPNITSYTGSWMIWFAERGDPSATAAALTPPVPLRKVDPKYYPAEMADRVEGKVMLAAVLRKDGRLDSILVLRHVDERLDQSAQDALDKWEFQPALRNGEPVDVDLLIEIPFRLAPKVPK
jgi:TonB family protein